MPRSTPARLAALAVLLSACAAPPAASAPASSAPVATPSPAASAGPTEPASPEPRPLAWSELAAIGPPGREDHTWTVDPSSGVAYLFGGRDGAVVFGDTWAFDLGADTWTELTPPSSPQPRFGHEAAWVDEIGLVIFGGQAGSAFFSDLWAFDPTTGSWSELPATGAAPVPRYGSCAAIGPDGRLWISHGFTEEQSRFSDTRAYDFANAAWTDETPASGAKPVERCLHGCWWTDAGELALYAGQTTGVTALDDRWLLRDGAWSRVEGALPPARNLYARARLGSGTLVFGGLALDETYLGDLWLLADGSVDGQVLEPAADPPPGRAGAELIVDAARDRALLFGGHGADGAFDDLWILSGL